MVEIKGTDVPIEKYVELAREYFWYIMGFFVVGILVVVVYLFKTWGSKTNIPGIS